MHNNGNGAGIYKLATALLAGIVISGASAFLVEGRGHTSREEVVTILETQSPWLRYERQFNQLVIDVKETNTELRALNLQVAALRAILERR